MRKTVYDYCIEQDKTALLQEWHPTKNLPLTPRDVTCGSARKIWWRCEKGHEWEAKIWTRTSSKGCPYCAGRKVLPGFNDLATREPEIAGQWHPTKNLPLTPRDVTCGSTRKIWWRCEKGHEWETRVFTRTSGNSGCPYCAGLKVWVGDNDLATERPDLAAQWHPMKNAPLTPKDVVTQSHRTVWWICEKGHEWQALVKSRADGSGCPFCTNRKVLPGFNDLATKYPELAGQWHPSKNDKLTPSNVVTNTTRKVWWRCEKGHEWQASIASRANGTGCPVCAGKVVIPGENDLATFFPELAEQWHQTKNKTMTPENVSPYSNQKVWWICPLGHEYEAKVASRAYRGTGCPYCSGNKVLPGFNDLATREPGVAAQWHPTLNGGLTPQMVTTCSHKKVWWECPDGHVWKAVIHSRAGPQKCGCPVCAGRVKQEWQARYRAAAREYGQTAATAAFAIQETENRRKSQ